MDVQGTPSPYASLSAPQPPAGNPPALGQQVPGRAGGLPAQGGLSVLANPMAKELQSYGRGDDTMLVHMTPEEVNSLQGLAMAHGGSLTINPHTGLPEAGWLGKLLPTILGAAGMAFGIPPVWMGALGAVGGTIATGDLGKGLSMGLQAYGGASMAGGLGLTGKISHNALGLMGNASGSAAQAAAAKAAQTAALEQTAAKLPGVQTAFMTPAQASTAALENVAAKLPGVSAAFAPPTSAAVTAASDALAAAQPLSAIAPGTIAANTPALYNAPTGFFGKFAEASRTGLPGGIIGKAAPMLAAQGVMSGLSAASTPSGGSQNAQGQVDNSYQGPYTAQRRTATFAPSTEELLASTKERKYFDVDMPEIYNMQGQVVQPGSQTAPGTPILQSYLLPTPKKKDGSPMYGFREVPYMQPGFARGGEVELADGAFVVDARTVSELGNGSSGAGQELLARMGGRPVQGPGDGVSDSVPARIGRDQPARVARDEVIFDPMAVRRIGGGDERRGASKLYAMMDKAHAARKRAERGTDTKLRKGLA